MGLLRGFRLPVSYELSECNRLFVFFQALVTSMLDVEPSNRPSASQILQHSWMTTRNLANTRLNLENPGLVKVSN